MKKHKDELTHRKIYKHGNIWNNNIHPGDLLGLPDDCFFYSKILFGGFI